MEPPSSMFNTLLDQGKKFLDIQKEYKYLVDPHLQLIEETSPTKLKSIIENFSSTKPIAYNIKLQQLLDQMSPTNNDGSIKGSNPPFSKLVKTYGGLSTVATNDVPGLKSCTGERDSDGQAVASAYCPALANALDMYPQLINLNKLVGSKSANITDWNISKNYGAGSGQKNAGDQPNLLAVKKGLMNTNVELSNQRDIYDAKLANINNLMGSQRDTEIRAQAAYYKYIVWTIVSLTLISYTIKYILK